MFYFRNNASTNPQSSAASGQTAAAAASGAVATAAAVQPATNALPDAVRIVLQLPQGRAIAGRLQRDWRRPTFGASG